MIVTIDVTMDYALEPGDPVLLALAVLPSPAQTILHSDLQVQDAQLSWLDQAGAAGQRVWVLHEGVRLLARYAARVQISRAAPLLDRLSAVPMHDLPTEALAALRPSLFCPSDRFGPFVQDRFGHLSGGAMIAAMRDWVAGNLRYVPGASDAATTALDTFVTRQGVCRDYAHLLCAFARAAGVPARYVSGYSPSVTPPDFHACAEVWLEGGWQLVDPTGMSTPGNFAVIASGRDAGDVAFMETAGWATVVRQEVRVG
ncbi:MAG: transglutaminase-like protein [Roseibaca calidilacus]|uniref:Transglutaminase-like enzyme, putative cysteine protease n=1 Tax=Roseibaca calidilacus TaxID=1666912 RepID=A0A0P8A726_9RHOB|nr:transglutaminase family protein [Roseibaca calidilacus]KPP89923.1 MAG: transglutaminase-like protein [Roseibaca calidilacus]CUX81009.1 Transglutaminase-like enzyme, putative cysteine protease [Roseibaca calidilacus]